MGEYFIIYETTNLINGKKYRGMHKTSNLNDGYLGSGVAIKKAILKHGKENFIREILYHCNSYDELIEKEKLYVDEKWIEDKTNYNLKTGGQNGSLSDESKDKISETLKRKYKNGEILPNMSNIGRIPSDEERYKISKTMKERYQNEDHHLKGKHQSDELKKKISDSLKERYKQEKHPMKGRTPWNKGKKGVQISWKKNIKMEKIECQYCGLLVDKCNGKRWHFDNCKKKKEE